MNKNKWNINFPEQNSKEIIEPFGSINIKNEKDSEKKEIDKNELKIKKANEISNSPSKTILMTIFLLWISGNQIQIFPIIITIMNIYQPIMSIINIEQIFQEVEGIPLKKQKIIFIFWNLIQIGLGMMKCYYMGIFSRIEEMTYEEHSNLVIEMK